MKNKKLLFYFSKWSLPTNRLDDIIRVKAGTALKRLFLKLRLIAGGHLSPSFVKEAKIFAIKLKRIRDDQGVKGLVLYLKSSSILLQQSLAKYRIIDCGTIGPRVSRTGSGIPRIIPRAHRLIMVNRLPGCYLLMRYYLSIFYIYRVLTFPGKLKIETISLPGKWLDLGRFEHYIERFLTLFIKRDFYRIFPLESLKKRLKIFPIFRSSPWSSTVTYDPIRLRNRKVNKKIRETQLWSTHVVSLIDATRSVMLSSLYPLFKDFIDFLSFKEIDNLFKYHKGIKLDDFGNLSGPLLTWGKINFKYFPWGHDVLGKLAIKEEAAGKVRVFAMVDPITQWLLAPLHKYLFSILRSVPMDGTFNQLGPIKRLLSLKGNKGLYSLDLSAATDRLPVSLQARILDILFENSNIRNFGQKWAALLVNRYYQLRAPKYDFQGTVKYSVGQPMGALSSWAMLALTHHFIIQVAAWEVGHSPFSLFKNYAILGDDMVVADHKVARQYLRILSDLGVDCNLSKSILSPKGVGLEFAKTTIIEGKNVSPISLEELSQSLTDLSTWAAFQSKYDLTWERQMQILGFGYLSRRKSFKKFNHAMKLIYISQIAKVDFNTDILKLGRRHRNLDFDGIILDIFKSKVLYPLFQRLFKIHKSFPNWLDQQRKIMNIHIDQTKLFDRYDLRNAFDLVIGKTPTSPAEVIIRSLLKTMNEDSIQATLYFSFTTRVFDWMWPHLNVNTFDQALSLYFDLNRQLGKLSLDIYGLEPVISRLPAKKLPAQAKLFRDWSLVSHRIVSAFVSQQKGD